MSRVHFFVDSLLPKQNLSPNKDLRSKLVEKQPKRNNTEEIFLLTYHF